MTKLQQKLAQGFSFRSLKLVPSDEITCQTAGERCQESFPLLVASRGRDGGLATGRAYTRWRPGVGGQVPTTSHIACHEIHDSVEHRALA